MESRRETLRCLNCESSEVVEPHFLVQQPEHEDPSVVRDVAGVDRLHGSPAQQGLGVLGEEGDVLRGHLIGSACEAKGEVLREHEDGVGHLEKSK